MSIGESVLVVLDGPTKVGTTYLANEIDSAAVAAGLVYPDDYFEPWMTGFETAATQDATFAKVMRFSAGNVFRAATLLVAEEGDKPAFGLDDVPAIREVLARTDIEPVLQHDPRIKESVSTVAKAEGVQDVCNTIVGQMVTEAYFADGGANLVILDGRRPLTILDTYGFFGAGPGQVKPESTLPVHVSAPVDVAARRLVKPVEGEGQADYERRVLAEAEIIGRRRAQDEGREEFPYVVPELLTPSLEVWTAIVSGRAAGNRATHFHFDNGENTTPFDVKRFAGQVARLSGVVSRSLSMSSASA